MGEKRHRIHLSNTQIQIYMIQATSRSCSVFSPKFEFDSKTSSFFEQKFLDRWRLRKKKIRDLVQFFKLALKILNQRYLSTVSSANTEIAFSGDNLLNNFILYRYDPYLDWIKFEFKPEQTGSRELRDILLIHCFSGE